MKRRSFLLASGSAVLSGTALSGLQKPAFGLEFELSSVPSKQPDNVSSVLVDFSLFELIPKYIDDSKDAEVEIKINIGRHSDSIRKSVSVTNGESVTADNLTPEIPIALNNISITGTSVDGNIKILVEHESAGTQTYSQSFTIEKNPLVNDIVAYYPMEKGAGDVLHDATGNNDANIEGANWNDNANIGANSLRFDGMHDYVNTKVLFDKTEFTYSAWFKADVVTDNHSLINSYEGSSEEWAGLFVGDSEVEFHVDNNGTKVVLSSSFTDTSNWHLLTGTFAEDGTMKLYLDGEEVDGDVHPETDVISSVNTEHIGNRADNLNDEEFDGLIDDVRIYDRDLSGSEITDLYNLTESSGKRITEDDVPNNNDGGVSRYKLDRNADDSWGSNNGNDTLSSGYGSGVYNSSKIFDGSTGYIEISDDSSLALTNLTISLWAYRNGSKSKEYLFDGRGHNYYIKLDDDTNKPLFGGQINSNGQNIILDDPIPNKEWVHIVGTFDGDKLRLYVNGDLKKTRSQSGGFDTSSGTARIGDYTGGGYKFRGRIDDVRIYDRILTGDEIHRLFSLGSYEL